MAEKLNLREVSEVLGVRPGTFRYHVELGRIPYTVGARRGRGRERFFDLGEVFASLGLGAEEKNER